MHEAGIIASLLETAGRKAAEDGATRILSIRLRVGAWSSVVPEALQHAFLVLRAGTPASGADLVLDPVQAVCWCAVCNREFEPRKMEGECPDCGTPSLDIRRGLELDFISMEVD